MVPPVVADSSRTRIYVLTGRRCIRSPMLISDTCKTVGLWHGSDAALMEPGPLAPLAGLRISLHPCTGPRTSTK